MIPSHQKTVDMLADIACSVHKNPNYGPSRTSLPAHSIAVPPSHLENLAVTTQLPVSLASNTSCGQRRVAWYLVSAIHDKSTLSHSLFIRMPPFPR